MEERKVMKNRDNTKILFHIYIYNAGTRQEMEIHLTAWNCKFYAKSKQHYTSVEANRSW